MNKAHYQQTMHEATADVMKVLEEEGQLEGEGGGGGLGLDIDSESAGSGGAASVASAEKKSVSFASDLSSNIDVETASQYSHLSEWEKKFLGVDDDSNAKSKNKIVVEGEHEAVPGAGGSPGLDSGFFQAEMQTMN
jgi:hypothetical protein